MTQKIDNILEDSLKKSNTYLQQLKINNPNIPNEEVVELFLTDFQENIKQGVLENYVLKGKINEE